jgi:hypothetical protein
LQNFERVPYSIENIQILPQTHKKEKDLHNIRHGTGRRGKGDEINCFMFSSRFLYITRGTVQSNSGYRGKNRDKKEVGSGSKVRKEGLDV